MAQMHANQSWWPFRPFDNAPTVPPLPPRSGSNQHGCGHQTATPHENHLRASASIRVGEAICGNRLLIAKLSLTVPSCHAGAVRAWIIDRLFIADGFATQMAQMHANQNWRPFGPFRTSAGSATAPAEQRI